MNRQRVLLVCLLVFALPCVVFFASRVVNMMTFPRNNYCYLDVILKDAKQLFTPEGKKLVKIYAFTGSSQSQFKLNFGLSQGQPNKEQIFCSDVSPKYSFFRGIWKVKFFIIAFSDGTLAVSDVFPENIESLEGFQILNTAQNEDFYWFPSSAQRDDYPKGCFIGPGAGISVLFGFSNGKERYMLTVSQPRTIDYACPEGVLPTENEPSTPQSDPN